MILLFGATMYLSSKLTMKPPTDPQDQMDEQQINPAANCQDHANCTFGNVYLYSFAVRSVCLYGCVQRRPDVANMAGHEETLMPEFVDVTEGDDDVSPPPSEGDGSKGKKKKDVSDSGKNGSSKESGKDSSKDSAKEAKKADESVKKNHGGKRHRRNP